MVIYKNPFNFKEIPPDAPFCNREQELSALLQHAKAGANVVLFSPRRYGKTSLVRRVQHQLTQTGFHTLFADFFGVTSLKDVATRLAHSVFKVAKPEESLFKKALRLFQSFRPVLQMNEQGEPSLALDIVTPNKKDIDLLEETLEAIAQFAKESSNRIHIALDEFQEIVTLQESRQIEGILRSHIQRHPFSYFFIGSRRRILLAMFNERSRPFFQSAINVELKTLPTEELIPFLEKMFRLGKKICSAKLAAQIAEIMAQHPYYSQKLSYFLYETSGNHVKEADISKAYQELLQSERVVFESIQQGLAPKQILLLRALAKEPSPSLFAIDFIKRHQLSSSGAIQGSIKKLTELDLIEKQDGCWRIVDPLFAKWLQT